MRIGGGELGAFSASLRRKQCGNLFAKLTYYFTCSIGVTTLFTVRTTSCGGHDRQRRAARRENRPSNRTREIPSNPVSWYGGAFADGNASQTPGWQAALASPRRMVRKIIKGNSPGK